MASVTLRAFAKINLSLRVHTARADGFHEVETILQAIDLADRVTCEARRGPFAIRCEAPGVPVDQTNLVWKAAQQLWHAAGRGGEPRDTMVTLEKNIPTQAGLGGGSSDAAAALLGLRRLWKLRIADDDVYGIASALGSDVPYFLVGGTALGLGRGERVYPLADMPRLWVALALPGFGVATKDAYAWLDARRGGSSLAPLSAPKGEKGAPPLFPHLALVNDLEPPVIERHPVIGKLKERLLKEGALVAAMSGSGSTVFGVFGSKSAARTAAATLKRAGVGTTCARFQRRTPP